MSLLSRLALLISLTALPLEAQESLAHAHWENDVSAWASIGVGGGSIHGVAGMLRENVSLGPVLVTVRQSEIGPFLDAGPGVMERAVLAGVRSSNRRSFASAVVGYSRANAYQQHCFMDCPGRDVKPSQGAFAYDASLHVNEIIPGLFISVGGTIGPTTTTYSALLFGVELGWFGR